MTVTQTSWTPTTATTLRITPQDRSPIPPAPATERTAMLTIPEVATACRISQTSVRRAIADGELQAVKLRSRIRITREAFDAWISAQQRPATRGRPRPAPRPKASRPKKAPKVFPPPGSFRELSRSGLNRDAA
jgi:excisionase family DNA binding protein